MFLRNMDREGDQVIMHTDGVLCATTQELATSEAFTTVLNLFFDFLLENDSPLPDELELDLRAEDGRARVLKLMRVLAENPLDRAVKAVEGMGSLIRNPQVLNQFVESLYDYWRHFDRYLICHSEQGSYSHDRRPYRTFNVTVERLTHLVRALYRDVCENIVGAHPRIYRQVSAGCDVGVIAVMRDWNLPAPYAELLQGIPFIRHVLINPPLIIDPPENRRTGRFQKVDANPLKGMTLDKSKWLCYPAQVGDVVVFVYFHQRFIGLGCSLANLFELASDDQIAAGPDAVYLYGVPAETLHRFGDLPTVFHDDEANRLLVAAVPGEDRFGYFGYLKKMILTLHNVAMMKRGRMPFHGAMTRIVLKDGSAANILLIGDTATGKSETLEALRILGKGQIREMRIIADDMGSLEVTADNRIVGYGTETGAFIRLDDLQQGYALQQVDRAIIMSPQKTNARVVLPVTFLEEILAGYPVEAILYANNYEEVDTDHPIIQRFDSVESALGVFRDGAAMSKGTTSATGLVHSYFANVFGPPQFADLHDKLAVNVFEAAFRGGVLVGQIRTRLAIPGCERKGPEEAAKALFEAISKKGAKSKDK